MTNEEWALPKLTQCRLHTSADWTKWDAACDKQLEAHYTAGAFLDPIPCPEHVPGSCLNILRIHWTFAIKDDGTRKVCTTMDGSKCAAPWLRVAIKTYALCVGQSSMKLFFTISATTNKIVIIADTMNAYQQSPPPTKPCFLEIDEAYQSWFLKKFGKDIDPGKFIIPLGCALQGHPEAGALWEKMIVEILETIFGFQSTTHEQNIYRGEVKGEIVFVCHQVDDFAIASDTIAMADFIISEIDKCVSTSNKGIGTKYNGVDILQTHDYIKLYCESYIDKVLLSHGWSEPGLNESTHHDMVPLSLDLMMRLQELIGRPEGSTEHTEIEKKVKFSY